MRMLAGLGAVAMLVGPGPALAQAQATPSSLMAQQPCAPAETRTATIAGIAALGDDAIGRCFTVEGIAAGFWLYADNEARYRRERAENDPSSTGAVLGLYGRDRGAPPARVAVTGRIDRCQRIFDAVVAEGNVPFLTGYCHYYAGLALFGRTVEERGPADLSRVTLRDAGDLGTLRPLAEGSARQRLLAAAAPFFEALQRSDEATLHGLIAASGQQQADRTGELIAHPAVAAWRAMAGPAGLAVLGWQRPADATAEQQARWEEAAAEGPEAIVCSAPPAFAEANLWPISRADTGIMPGRPYLCVSVWLPASRPPSYSFSIDRPSPMAAREPAP